MARVGAGLAVVGLAVVVDEVVATLGPSVVLVMYSGGVGVNSCGVGDALETIPSEPRPFKLAPPGTGCDDDDDDEPRAELAPNAFAP